MTLKFYGYKKCSTCRSAMKWLEAHGIAYTFVDVIEQPPTLSEFEAALAAGLPIRKLFNTSGIQYREQGMKAKLAAMSQPAALEALCANGYFVKRPFVIAGLRVTVGFKPEEYAEVWG